MKRLLSVLLSILLCFNSTMTVFGEDGQNVLEDDSIVEIVEDEKQDDQEVEEIDYQEDEIIENKNELSQEKKEDYSLDAVSGPLTSGDVLHTGSCGENLTYTHYSDYSLVISGTGDMYDYNDSNPVPWAEWAQGWKPVYSIVIEEGVTSIGDYAFEYIFNVKEPIVLPSTLTKIGESAFDGDYLISKVYIPNTVTTIESNAFRECSETLVLYTDVLNAEGVPAGWDSSWNKSITYDENLQAQVYEYIVSYNTSLNTFNDLSTEWNYNPTTKTLTISGNGPMTTYLWDGQPWFSNKSNIEHIVIEEGVTIISPDAFMMMFNASSVSIPSTVFYIGENAFNMCNLTSVTIPASVTRIGHDAFGSGKTESMTVESGNTTYDSRDNCNAIIETATNILISGCKNTIIPSTVTTIAKNAFQSIDGMTSFDFPSTVEHIYPNFLACSDINKIFVSKDIDVIDKKAFFALDENLIIYTDVEDSANIPAGWDADWNLRGDGQYFAVMYDTSHEEFVEIASHQPAPDDISIKENTSGNIVISTNDTNYLEALTVVEPQDAEETNTYVGIQDDDNSTNVFRNFINSYSYEITILHYDESKKTVTIKNDDIKTSNIVNGSRNIRIVVDGYEDFETTITLSHACKAAPTDVAISGNANGDIVITSSDTGWIKSLAKDNPSFIGLYDDQDFTYDGDVKYIYGYNSSIGSFVITNSGKTLTITNECILNNYLQSGTYYLRICAKGYGELLYNGPVVITKGAQVIDSNTLSISCDQVNGTIKVVSNSNDNDAFMEKLTSYTIVNWKSGYNEANGGCIEFVNLTHTEDYPKSFRNEVFKYGSEVQGQNDDFELSADKKTLTITNEAILRRKLIKGNDYRIQIQVPGYLIDNIEISDISVGVESCPADINISQNTSGDIVISSNNLTYLQTLTTENDDWANYVTVFKDNYSQGGHLELANTTYEHNLVLDESAKTVTIKNKDLLLFNYELTGEHAIGVYVNGYTSYVDEQVNLQYTGQKDPAKKINAPTSLVLNGLSNLTFADFDSDVEWISSNENVATIDSTGELEAKSLGTTTIIAKHYVDGNNVYDKVNVNVVSNTKVVLKLQTTDKNTVAVVGEDEDLLLTATGYTLTGQEEVVYTATPEEKVSISGNTVSFLEPGTVTITANAVGRTATLKLTVYKVDPTKKVTLLYSGGTLEAGDVVSDKLEMKAGGEDLPNGTELTYASSNIKVATIDEDGEITAIGKGTSTITVALKDDPAKRKATCKVTVIDRIIYSLDKDVLNVENATGSSLVFTNTNPENDDDSRIIQFDYADVNKQTKLHIIIDNSGIDKNSENYTPAGVKFTSTDSSVASVDKNGNVTFKKAGLATITVTVTSNPKGMEVVSRDIIFKAVNFAPRIEVNKFTLNKYLEPSNYPSYNFYEVLGNSVNECTITETNGVDSQYFDVDTDSNTFKVKFKAGVTATNVPAKSYSQILKFKTGADPDYKYYNYKITVVVAQNIPSVTSKVTGYYNTFTNENTLELVNTVKNGEISNIEFVDDWASYESGVITPKLENDKYATSGKVRYTFNGYVESVNVEKTIKLPVKSVKPTIKLNNSSFTVYNPDNTPYVSTNITVKLLDANKNVITNGTVTIGSGTFAKFKDKEIDEPLELSDDGSINIVAENGKFNLLYQASDEWNDNYIILPITIKTTKSLPKAKLSTTTVKLNRLYHKTDSVNIAIPGSPEVISNDTIIELDGQGSTGITPSISNGVIKFETDNSKTTNDTYTYVVTPKTVSGLELTPIKIKVVNSSAAPKTTVSVKNALNPLDKNSSSVVSLKFNNPVDEISSIEFTDDQYKDLFEINKVSDDFILKIIEGKDLSVIKDQTIKTNVLIYVGEHPITSPITIKLARKAPTVKLETPTINVYDTSVEENTLVGETVVNFDYDGYKINDLIIPESLGYKVEYDQTDHKLKVYMLDGSKIKAGSTSPFSIKIIWKDDFVNNGKFTKTTSVKLNVKDVSYSIKAVY